MHKPSYGQRARSCALVFLPLALGASASAQIHGAEHGRPLEIAYERVAPATVETRELDGDLLTVDETRVHYDVQPDGVVWASGRRFKASFGPAGASITPFLGSDAPRNHPVTFALESATIGGAHVPVEHAVGAIRAGANVRFERGAIVENYDLEPNSIQQSFDLHAPIGAGDLALRVAYHGDLNAAQVEDGITFTNARGGLHYTHAVAIDADGDQVEIPATLVDGAIEIVVPAAFLATADYPVRVDPTITISTVDATTLVHRDPDVSYDYLTQRSIVCFVRVFSSVDRDVYARALNPAGGAVDGAYVDQSSEDWTSPRIASQRSLLRHLVVATRVPIGGGESRVWGRVINTGIGFLTAPFPISGVETGSVSEVDVGGDQLEDPNGQFLVSWTLQPSGSMKRVCFRRVNRDGIPDAGGTWQIPSVVPEYGARISQASDAGAWTIVWEREVDPSNRDVLLARISTSGNVDFAYPLATSLSDERRPNVSTRLDGSGRYLVTCEVEIGGNSAIRAYIFNDTVLEGFFTPTLSDGSASFDNVDASIETDGSHFLLTYTRAGAQALVTTEIFVLASAPVSVGLVSSSTISTNLLGRGSLSSHAAAGATGRRLGLVWSADDDIYLARIDNTVGGPIGTACFGDGTGIACPCSNFGGAGRGCANSANSAGARLYATGNALITGDTLVLRGEGMPPNSTCLYYQGTGISTTPTTFGDGIRCVAGTVVRIGTKLNSASGISSYPESGDQAVSVRGLVPAYGGLCAYQIWHRNAASFCTASTFNLSNGLFTVFTP